MSPTPAGTERPLRADAERNRRRILVAAREVFARRGLAAGLDDIARHAGVGTGTVYRRFPDKNGLIEALFTDRFDQVLACVEQAAGRSDPWEGLSEALHSLVAMQIEDHGLKDVLFSHFGATDALREHVLRLVPLLETLIRRAQAVGALRPDVALTDLAVAQLMVTEVAAFTADTDPEIWRRYLGLLLDGLRTNAARPGQLPRTAMTLDEFDTACGRAGLPAPAAD